MAALLALNLLAEMMSSCKLNSVIESAGAGRTKWALGSLIASVSAISSETQGLKSSLGCEASRFRHEVCLEEFCFLPGLRKPVVEEVSSELAQ